MLRDNSSADPRPTPSDTEGSASSARPSGQAGDPKGAGNPGRKRSDKRPNHKRDKSDGAGREQGRDKRQAPLTAEQVEARKRSVPKIAYPDLPVSARRDEIARAIRDNQVVVVAGETGSGKTTQLPKICLELGRGTSAMIGHTQPRRIAARAVADRLAHELGVDLGAQVGYQVRFTEEVSPGTLVKLMTDGILLAEIQSDPELARYDTIIIDEAHERSLNIDFLLGYLARLLPRRPDLKVIITSATIDTQRFAKHFNAPVVEVSGRTYPVEIRYRPLVGDDGGEATDQVTGIVEACEELMAEGPGDILVFLSGEGEIRDAQAAFADELGRRHIEPGGRSSVPDAVEVLPLYSRLSAAEQHRIFERRPHRRIILATNIAETSLTVPGIRYVVDPGTARISRYSARTKVQRLPIEPISQASANQRAGRSGRVADGICIRLYSQEDFDGREKFTQPEIQRTSLASVILQMLALGLGNVADFPFIDPPEERAVRAGAQLLTEIGAIDGARLTPVGRRLARLPIDPRLGRMLLEADKNGCASEVLVLVAALSVQDVRERPAEKRPQADQLHARFTARSSDFLAYLTLWRYLNTQRRELSGSAFRRMCRTEFLNYLRFREWADVVAQLRQLAKPLGIDAASIGLPGRAQIRQAGENGAPALGGAPNSGAAAAACRDFGRGADTPEAGAIHRSMLVGLLSNLGNYSQRSRDYEGARGAHFVIWPGSGLSKRTPAWVMAAELVETSRLFARTVAAIEPQWIEPLAKNLVKRTYSEPFWSSRNGAAMCKEKVTLYGMTLAADRPVLLASTGSESAREEAREMFILHGLVEGDWRTHHAFLKDNERALEEARELEEKMRRRGLVAGPEALAAFYDERIPDFVVSGRHFDSWWKKAKRDDPHLLDFTQELLVGEAEADENDYPAEWRQGEIRLPIEYSFSPGAYADGVTVTIPVTLLPQVRPEGFDWLVPGMREDLVTGTIRALPKRVRRQLVPAPDVARQILPLLPRWEDVAHGQEGAPSFRRAFAEAVFRLRGFWIDDAAWEEARLPEHLSVLFRVRSERGAVLDESTSLERLKLELAPRTRSAVESVVKGAVAQALDEAHFRLAGGAAEGAALPLGESLGGWPDASGGVIPTSVETTGAHGMTVRGYPALAAGADGKVRLDVLADPALQAREHRRGLAALLAAAIALPEARITSRWPGAQALALAGSPYPDTSALVADIQLASARNLAAKWAAENGLDVADVRTRSQWDELRAWAKQRHEDEVYRISLDVAEICARRAEVDKWITESRSPALLATLADVKEQVANLVPSGFVSRTPAARLPHIERYLRAAYIRIQKAATNPSGDDALAWQIQDVNDKVEAARAAAASRAYDPSAAAALDEARWMVEELRVSLFAQQLGTNGKVSAKRIAKVLART
ncbi:ATP-dependent RNA helicase HrpA [Peptidiphaga gingivicola]|uniref:ATP-dependent RNA helicase HrpA n=1 Tax=Peptidiphaga gingivicola TaxID=2741497 RepID=UPI000A7F38C9|nr:ATP-dependent RNA helicase HrpA [Peptidiphaga gingivicola]